MQIQYSLSAAVNGNNIEVPEGFQIVDKTEGQ